MKGERSGFGTGFRLWGVTCEQRIAQEKIKKKKKRANGDECDKTDIEERKPRGREQLTTTTATTTVLRTLECSFIIVCML